jgi:ATP-dependent DNA helicase RecG
MPRQMYEERLKLSNPNRFCWENKPNQEIRLEDINTELLFQTLHDGINSRRIHASAMTLRDPIKIMQKLGVAQKDGAILNAANVLFGRDPPILHTQCKVRLARFEGTDKRIFRDQTVCEGNLFEQYDTIIDFCLKHLNIAGRMDSKYRQDTLTVPYEAIKEATINMICHRSWNYQNMTPSLAIYDDRMVFQNPGSFPIGMKWQDFLGDEIGSLPANPIIANVFYRRGIMEAWGRGIGLIIKSCKEQQLVKPEINVTQSFVNLTIWFKKSLTINHTPSHTPSYTPSYTPSHANNGDKIECVKC